MYTPTDHSSPTLAEEFGFTRDDAQRISQLACDLLESGDLDNALMVFEGLLTINPRDWAARAAYGAVLERAGREVDAEVAYSEAIAANSACELARLNRGLLRMRRGDPAGRADLMAISANGTGPGAEARRILGAAQAKSR